MKATELRQLNDGELIQKADEFRAALAELRYNNRFSPVENPARINVLRKSVARIYTILTERANAAQ